MTKESHVTVLQDNVPLLTAEVIPQFLKTEKRQDGSLIISEAVPGDAPVYYLTKFTEANELEALVTDFRADGTRIVQVRGISERQTYIDNDQNTFGFEGHFGKFYIIPADSNHAFELQFDLHVHAKMTDNEYKIRSHYSVNDWRQTTYDYQIEGPAYQNDTKTVHYIGKYTAEDVDWKNINFYSMVRYSKIQYAGQHIERSDEFVIATILNPGPGLMDKYFVHELNRQDPKGTVRKSDLKVDTFKGVVRDDQEKGITGSDYQKIDAKELSQDICLCVRSFNGGIQYVTPTNYQSIRYNLNQQ